MKLITTTTATDFKATLSLDEGGRPTVSFVGRAEAGAKEVLRGFLESVDAELVAQKVRSATIDIRELTFMSSSCFKDFVVWLSRVNERKPTEQYMFRFMTSAAIRWQKASLSSLSCFALNLVEVVER